MVTQYQTDIVTRKKPMTNGTEGDVISVRAVWVATAALGLNDWIEMAILPAEHVLVYAAVDTDQLDSNGAPTLTLDVGMVSGEPGLVDSTRTVTADFLSASTVAQTSGGSTAVLNVAKAYRVQPASYDRSIGIKAHAAAATGVTPLSSLSVNRGIWQPSTVYAQNDYVYMKNGLRAKCTTAGTSAGNPAGVWPFTNYPFTLPGNALMYNSTITDGTVTWTIADPAIGLSLLMVPARWGN